MDTEIEQRKKVLEGKLDGMHLKIAIVKHKQAQAIQETEDAEKEIQCEKRKRASMAEGLERKVVQMEKKKADALTYQMLPPTVARVNILMPDSM